MKLGDFVNVAQPDSAHGVGTPTRFIAGGFAGTMGMWFLMRATPLFNAHHRANKRLVTVLFPTWVACGTANVLFYNRNRENILQQRWGRPTIQFYSDIPFQVFTKRE